MTRRRPNCCVIHLRVLESLMRPATLRAQSTATLNPSTKKGKEVRLIHPITVKGIKMVVHPVADPEAPEDQTPAAVAEAEVSPLV